jgi:integrase
MKRTADVQPHAIRNKGPLAITKRKRFPNCPPTETEIRKLLFTIDNNRDDSLIRLGLSVSPRVSEVVAVRLSEIDFDRGLVKIWDEKKDPWRLVMPTLETRSAIKRYLNALPKQPQHLFPVSTKPVDRIIQGYSKRALGFIISWHAPRANYVSRSADLEQSPAAVTTNTGDSPATILKYYAKPPEVAMRRFVEGKPVIPSERL